MKKQTKLYISIVVTILFVLIVCGSIWDFEIANAVYIGQTPSENAFGIIFSYIGVIPTFVGWSFLGASILCLSRRVENTVKRRWLIALSVLLFTLSFFYFCNTLYLSNATSFEVHFAVAYSIGLAILFIFAYLGYRLAQSSKDSELLKKVLFLVAVSLLTLLIISITKELMCRPRFRFVLDADNVDYFKNWWESGREIKASLGMGMESDEFASLPSGHSAYSMFAIFIFPVLADYVFALKKFKAHLFAFGFIWWTMTAFSRLTVGAHYLSDVAIAGLVTIFSYLVVFIVKERLEGNKRVKRNE
jgi:membrane-associated phospholipid phosphatase